MRPLRHRWRSDSIEQKSINELVQLEAPVESIVEFGQIARQMFAFQRMVSAMHGVFQVAEYDIHPMQGEYFHAGSTAAGNDGVMLKARFVNTL